MYDLCRRSFPSLMTNFLLFVLLASASWLLTQPLCSRHVWRAGKWIPAVLLSLCLEGNRLWWVLIMIPLIFSRHVILCNYVLLVSRALSEQLSPISHTWFKSKAWMTSIVFFLPFNCCCCCCFLALRVLIHLFWTLSSDDPVVIIVLAVVLPLVVVILVFLFCCWYKRNRKCRKDSRG